MENIRIERKGVTSELVMKLNSDYLEGVYNFRRIFTDAGWSDDIVSLLKNHITKIVCYEYKLKDWVLHINLWIDNGEGMDSVGYQLSLDIIKDVIGELRIITIDRFIEELAQSVKADYWNKYEKRLL